MGSLSSLGVQFTTGLPQPWFGWEKLALLNIPWKWDFQLIFKEKYFHLDRLTQVRNAVNEKPLHRFQTSRGLRFKLRPSTGDDTAAFVRVVQRYSYLFLQKLSISMQNPLISNTKGEKTMSPEICSVKHPLHWIIFPQHCTFQWRCFSNHSRSSRVSVSFSVPIFRPQGGFFFFRVSFGDTTPGSQAGRFFRWFLQVESWRPTWCWKNHIERLHPLKFNMLHLKNQLLEKKIPFRNHHVLILCQTFGGVQKILILLHLVGQRIWIPKDLPFFHPNKKTVKV